MGQPDIVVEMAKPYLDIVAFSRSTYYFSGINNLLMKSDTKSSMWATIIGNVINVIVNYFLIYGFGFFLKWEL
jgi:MATE family multidrug resistance protein